MLNPQPCDKSATLSPWTRGASKLVFLTGSESTHQPLPLGVREDVGADNGTSAMFVTDLQRLR